MYFTIGQGLIGAFAAAVVSHNTVRRMVLSRCAGRAQDAIALGRSLTRGMQLCNADDV